MRPGLNPWNDAAKTLTLTPGEQRSVELRSVKHLHPGSVSYIAAAIENGDLIAPEQAGDPLPDGLLAGDHLLAVDGVSVNGLGSWGIRQRFRRLREHVSYCRPSSGILGWL